MQENEADHVIKIIRWLDACARFMEASKELTDYDIDGISRVVDIMRSMAEKSQLKKGCELQFVPGHDSDISEEQKEEISAYIDFLLEKRQGNQDIVRCGECAYQYHNAYGAAYCKHGYLFGAINDNTGCTYGKHKEAET